MASVYLRILYLAHHRMLNSAVFSEPVRSWKRSKSSTVAHVPAVQEDIVRGTPAGAEITRGQNIRQFSGGVSGADRSSFGGASNAVHEDLHACFTTHYVRSGIQHVANACFSVAFSGFAFHTQRSGAS